MGIVVRPIANDARMSEMLMPNMMRWYTDRSLSCDLNMTNIVHSEEKTEMVLDVVVMMMALADW